MYIRRPILYLLIYSYRPKRSFGQGNIFTPVCHSVHRGGCLLQIFGGVCSKFFGGVCSKFSGGCLLQIFGGGCLLQIFGGVSAPNFRGGVCSKFSGGSAPNFGGVSAPNFRGRGLLQIFGGGLLQIFGGFLPFSEYGHRSAGTHPTGMHSCLYCYQPPRVMKRN